MFFNTCSLYFVTYFVVFAFSLKTRIEVGEQQVKYRTTIAKIFQAYTQTKSSEIVSVAEKNSLGLKIYCYIRRENTCTGRCRNLNPTLCCTTKKYAWLFTSTLSIDSKRKLYSNVTQSGYWTDSFYKEQCISVLFQYSWFFSIEMIHLDKVVIIDELE